MLVQNDHPIDERSSRTDSDTTTMEGRADVALVIDDEPTVLYGLTLVLEQLGWEVVAAGSADEAMRRLAARRTCPDVIVADYRLRDGRTGAEAIRAVHAMVGRAVPAMLLTGDTSPDRLKEARRSGFTLLHKPVTIGELNNQLVLLRH